MENPNYKLSKNEINFIISEVKKSEISLTHLEDELIDHLCCMVEDLINDGYAFETAFEAVRKDVGIDTLKTIEIKTLILINKKFQAMKKTLKISGIIGLSAIVISSIFKINHWPGAGIILMLGFATLLFAYLPALFLTLKKEKILKRKMHLSYVGIITAFILLISFLFTLMNWPYRDYTIYLSWLFMLAFLIMLFKNIMKSEDNRVLNLSMLLFFSLLFVLDISLNLVSLNNPRLSAFTIENNLDASIKLHKYKTEKNYELLSTIKDSTHANEISEIKTKTNEIIGKIEQLRDALFANKTEQENFNKRLFKSNIITINIEDASWKLENEITPYREFMLNKASLIPELTAFVENSIRFGYLEFNNNPQIIYNNLQKLIRDVKTAESEVLSNIIFSIKTSSTK